MKYNIALLHYSCPPVVGGVEHIVHQQALLFLRYFHNVKIFAGKGSVALERYEVEINPLLGSRNREVLNAHKLCNEGRTEKMEVVAKKIFHYLFEALKGFDILIAHNVLTMPFNLPLSVALQRIGREGIIPIISWNHDSPYFYNEYKGHLDLFPWNILKRAYAGINYVVISESRKNMFASLYGTRKRLYVVPNGIDPALFFHLSSDTIRVIKEQRLFEAEFLMIQPSRLHPRKNIELSIHVTKALHDLGIKAKLIVTGAHDPHEPKSLDYYKKLKNLSRGLNIEAYVLIMAEHQFQSGEKISANRIILRDLYLIADILFLPSLQEGFGIPLLEAGMIKLPTVCSSIPPFVEIGGKDVCLFELDESPEKIANRIIDFTDGLKPHNMFRKVILGYTWDNIYNNSLLPLLKKIIIKT